VAWFSQGSSRLATLGWRRESRWDSGQIVRGPFAGLSPTAPARAAAKDLIDAALGYPPPYRDNMMQRTLLWTDYVDRAYWQGWHIPPPWGRRKVGPS